MAWAKIDDGWWAHPKVMGLSLVASGLWARALSWSCHQRRDVVPDRFLMLVGADMDDAYELVEAGLWVEVDEGWRIHDWADYQELSLSEKRADAGAKGGKKSGETRRQRSNAKQPNEANAKQTNQKDEAQAEAGPSRPVPTQPKEPTLPSTDVDRTDETFEEFWSVYPARNGKKVGKANALIEWRRLTDPQRERAMVGAKNLAASDQLPKDAERFLRRAKGGKGDFPFDDWQEPATTDIQQQRASVNSGLYREWDPDEQERRNRELEQRLGITS